MPADLFVPHNAVFWGAIILIVFFTVFFRYLTRRSRDRMLEKLAEKGQAVTPELIDRIDHMKSRHN